MRQEGTLATAIVVVLLSGVMSSAAMTGAFSKDKGAATVVTLDTPYGATDGTQAPAGRVAIKSSKGKIGSAAPGERQCIGVGLGVGDLSSARC